MKVSRCVLLFSLIAILVLSSTRAFSQTAGSPSVCQSLARLRIAKDSVAQAEWSDAGAVVIGTSPRGTKMNIDLPEHCTVHVVSEPSVDSHINITIWLPPAKSWNGKILGTGNGGYSGTLSYREMADGLQLGYAVGGSDTGHIGDDMRFGEGHPEKIRDWAYRAIHELAVAESKISTKFYGIAPSHAYFRGCSTGGQQALSEAQRYPKDFDGIIAGDAGSNRILLNADFMTSWLATHPDGKLAFPHAKLKLLANAAVSACDRNDGLADGIISDPIQCSFDPKVLACKPEQDLKECLTGAEIDIATALYAGTVRDSANKPMCFGWPKGSEAGWGTYLIDPTSPARLDFWKSWVYGDLSFAPGSFKAQAAVLEARKKLPYTEAVSKDLSGFAKRGGKLLMYHGWADSVVPPEDSVAYFNAVQSHKSNDFVELFMIPGMAHCGGGVGPSDFDSLAALDGWVTSGTAPQSLVGRKLENGKPVFERPLCPYPKEALWDGNHDAAKASSFECR